MPRVVGEANHSSKLTEASVKEIRRLLTEGARQSAVAILFAVSPTTISEISRGVTWRHVA
jgi:hypothetical protein